MVEIARVASPPLRDLVAAFMKPSQNLETDLIFGHLGELTRTAGTPVWRTTEELAVVVLEEFLQKHGLPAGEVRLTLKPASRPLPALADVKSVTLMPLSK